ncbi:MAG: PD-(D/E)XK nuclease family protein [Eggerthellaceae bacterium]
MPTIQERITRFKTYDLLRSAVVDAIRSTRENQRVYVFVNSPTEASKWRRYIADEVPDASFGSKVTTFSDFVQDAWILFGDDRRIIDSVHRTAAIAHCLQERELEPPTPSKQDKFPPLTGGSISVLAKAAEEVFYHQNARQILGRKASEGKVGSVRVLDDYARLLNDKRLIEIGEAIWGLLANAKLMSRSDVYIFVGTEYLLPAEEEFIVRSNAYAFELDPVGDTDAPGIPQLTASLYSANRKIEPTDKIRFAYSGGVNAEVPLLAQAIEEELSENPSLSIRIADTDPQSLYEKLAPVLARLGISSRSLIRWTFKQSEAGKAFRTLYHGCTVRKAADRQEMLAMMLAYTSGPYCKCSPYMARRLNEEAKKDRNITYDDYIDRLISEDGGIKCHFTKLMVGLLQAGDLEEALKKLYYKSIKISESNKYTFASPLLGKINMSLARKAWESAKYLKAYKLESDTQEDILMSLECYRTESTVGVADRCVQSELSVEFARFIDQPYSDTDVCIVSRMDANGMPAASGGDPVDYLFAYLGLEREDRIQKRMRDALKRTLLQTRDHIVFHADLHDADSNPVRAGVLLEEVYSCLPAVPRELLEDKTRGYKAEDGFIPASACYFHEEAGTELRFLSEDDLPLLASGSKRIQRTPIEGNLDSTGNTLTQTGLSGITTRAGEPLKYSASAIEAYHNCPHFWFITRALSVDSFEASNDNRAIGSFAHAVMEETYRALLESSERRVTLSNIEYAKGVLNEKFDEIAGNPAPYLGDRTLVLDTMLDKYRLEELRDPLLETLEMDALLFPGYYPTYLEDAYFDDDAVEYAGQVFVGKIDRIDVDEHNNAIVIDYKGTAGTSFSPKWHDPDNKPGLELLHPQTLIYAKMAQKKHPELKVVGTVFRGYRKSEIAGFIDTSVETGVCAKKNNCFAWREKEPLDLDSPLIDREEQVALEEAMHVLRHIDVRRCSTYADVLDACEDLIRLEIDDMLQGCVDARPLGPSSCSYCPAKMTCVRCMAK